MKRKGNYVSGSFSQRKCEFFTAESGLISSKALCLACTGDGTVYIGTDCGLSYTKADGSFGSFACPPVESIFAAKDGRVFFSCGKTLYIVENGSISEMQSFEDEIVDISGEDRVFLMTPPMLYVLDGGEFVPYLDTRESIGCASSLSTAPCPNSKSTAFRSIKSWASFGSARTRALISMTTAAAGTATTR